MKLRFFGTTGVQLPVVGQGTWDMPESGTRAREAREAIRRGVDLGMTHLDTAEMYGAGRVEELLGEAIVGIPREKLFIASKVLPANASYDGTLAAARRSIDRLGCGYLDLYMLHWPSEEPLEETMRALERLVSDGLVRFVGVSNFEADAMLEAASYLRATPLACNQVLYNLSERGIEHELVAVAERNGIAIVAYTPFARGKFLRSRRAGEVLDRVARRHGATVHQVALAFLLRLQNLFTIPKAARVRHVDENAAAAGLTLENEEIAAIDEAFPRRAAGPLAVL
ncbi:MAG: aldo/keto reductase [Candidatus Eremiobacteraeota bacterium]|nr:aldo/keto reductase [Candidatus Eremiobacteraeota bacterium]